MYTGCDKYGSDRNGRVNLQAKIYLRSLSLKTVLVKGMFFLPLPFKYPVKSRVEYLNF